MVYVTCSDITIIIYLSTLTVSSSPTVQELA